MPFPILLTNYVGNCAAYGIRIIVTHHKSLLSGAGVLVCVCYCTLCKLSIVKIQQ